MSCFFVPNRTFISQTTNPGEPETKALALLEQMESKFLLPISG